VVGRGVPRSKSHSPNRVCLPGRARGGVRSCSIVSLREPVSPRAAARYADGASPWAWKNVPYSSGKWQLWLRRVGGDLWLGSLRLGTLRSASVPRPTFGPRYTEDYLLA
jgi:hypothetical protein